LNNRIHFTLENDSETTFPRILYISISGATGMQP
jgi:hypothetical protein